MVTILPHTTRATGTVLTASIYNADHQNHITNAQSLNAGVAGRTIQGTSGQVTVTNGNGVSGDPTISLPTDTSLTSSDSGATAGPVINLTRNSSSPAANDLIGQMNFRGKDSGSNDTDYARIFATIADPANGSEDGFLTTQHMVAGSLTGIKHDYTGITAGQTKTIMYPNITTLGISVWEAIYHASFTAIGSSGIDILNLGAFEFIRILCSFEDTIVAVRVSTDNGSSFLQGASSYIRSEMGFVQAAGTTVAGAAVSENLMPLSTLAPASGFSCLSEYIFDRFNRALISSIDGKWATNHVTSNNCVFKRGGYINSATAFNAIKVYASSGTSDGYLTVEGIRG